MYLWSKFQRTSCAADDAKGGKQSDGGEAWQLQRRCESSQSNSPWRNWRMLAMNAWIAVATTAVPARTCHVFGAT